jgi:hypothetical protein
MTITPPIVVAEGPDVMVFRTRGDAERLVEARDVVGGIYRAWDGSGRALRLDISDAMCIDFAPVALSLAAQPANAAHDLANTLHAILVASGATPPETATVGELVAFTIAFVGYTR